MIPFAAIKSFADPVGAVHAAIRDAPEAGDAAEGDDDAETPREAAKPKLQVASPASRQRRQTGRQDSKREPGRTSVPASPLPPPQAPTTASGPSEPGADQPADKSGGAEVVRLDRFRKK